MFVLCLFQRMSIRFDTKDLLCNGTKIVMFLFYYRSFGFISRNLRNFHLFHPAQFQCILVWFQGMNDWIFFATLQRLWIFCSDDSQKFFSSYVHQTYHPSRIFLISSFKIELYSPCFDHLYFGCKHSVDSCFSNALTQRCKVPIEMLPIKLYAFGRYNPELYNSKNVVSASFLVGYFLRSFCNATTIFAL